MTTFKKEFEDKLNELGIKEAFERNEKAQSNASEDFDINKLDHWRAFVASAFTWHLSPEGHEYWLDISEK